jgi:hypothetical protein
MMIMNMEKLRCNTSQILIILKINGALRRSICSHAKTLQIIFMITIIIVQIGKISMFCSTIISIKLRHGFVCWLKDVTLKREPRSTKSVKVKMKLMNFSPPKYSKPKFNRNFQSLSPRIFPNSQESLIKTSFFNQPLTMSLTLVKSSMS